MENSNVNENTKVIKIKFNTIYRVYYCSNQFSKSEFTLDYETKFYTSKTKKVSDNFNEEAQVSDVMNDMHSLQSSLNQNLTPHFSIDEDNSNNSNENVNGNNSNNQESKTDKLKKILKLTDKKKRVFVSWKHFPSYIDSVFYRVQTNNNNLKFRWKEYKKKIKSFIKTYGINNTELLDDLDYLFILFIFMNQENAINLFKSNSVIQLKEFCIQNVDIDTLTKFRVLGSKDIIGNNTNNNNNNGNNTIVNTNNIIKINGNNTNKRSVSFSDINNNEDNDVSDFDFDKEHESIKKQIVDALNDNEEDDSENEHIQYIPNELKKLNSNSNDNTIEFSHFDNEEKEIGWYFTIYGYLSSFFLGIKYNCCYYCCCCCCSRS
jgi:hypothetical protein